MYRSKESRQNLHTPPKRSLVERLSPPVIDPDQPFELEPYPDFLQHVDDITHQIMKPDSPQVPEEQLDNQEMTYAIGITFGPEMTDFSLEVTQGPEKFSLKRKKRTKYIVTYVTKNQIGQLRLITEDKLPVGFHASDLPILSFTPAKFQRMLEQDENPERQENGGRIKLDRKNQSASKVVITSRVQFQKKTRQAS